MESKMTEIEDCIDWLNSFSQYLPKKYEHLGYGKTYKDLKNDSVSWGFSPEGIMSEFLYEWGLLEEFAEYMKEYVHGFYITLFQNYYSKLSWWSIFD